MESRAKFTNNALAELHKHYESTYQDFMGRLSSLLSLIGPFLVSIGTNLGFSIVFLMNLGIKAILRRDGRLRGSALASCVSRQILH